MALSPSEPSSSMTVSADPPAERRRRVRILSVLWLSLLLAAVLFRSVLLPFVSAALIAYLMAPLVAKLTSLRIAGKSLPKWASILVVYALFFLGVYLAILALVPQIYRELSRISREGLDFVQSLTPERLEQLATRGEAWLSRFGLPVDLSSRALEGSSQPGDAAHGALNLSVDLQQLLRDTTARVSGWIQENLSNIVAISRSVVSGVLAFVFMLFFVLMLAAYMSIDSVRIREYTRSLIPPEYAHDIGILVERIDRSLAGVVRGQVTICLVNGVLTFIGLMIFGVKFAAVLATLATLLSLIPIFGSILSSVPIVAIGLSQSWKTALAILAWIVAIHALEAYILNPKIMGSAARIHPIVVAFSLIAGERMFGLLGALFAVPVASVCVACFDFARQKAQKPAATSGP